MTWLSRTSPSSCRPDPEDPEKKPAASERKDSEVIIGQNGYPNGFDEQVAGMKPGDTRQFDLTWDLPGVEPVEEPAAAEGEDAATEEGSDVKPEPEKRTRTTAFTVVAKDIKRKSLPDVDDAFAASVGTYQTVTAMREDIKRRLYSNAMRSARAGTENKALDAAVEKTSFEIANRLIEMETNALVEERRRSFAQQRIPLERYLQIMGTSEEDWRQEQRVAAERQLKARVFLDAYADKEELSVSPEQIDREIDVAALSYGPQAAQAKRELSTPDSKRSIGRTLRRHLALEKLVGTVGSYPVDEMGVLNPDGTEKEADVSDDDAEVEEAVAATAPADEASDGSEGETAAGQ